MNSVIVQDVLLSLLAVAFLAWAGVVWRASKLLADKFDEMRTEFHASSLRVEHRLTRLEEKEVQALVAMQAFRDDIFSGDLGEDKDTSRTSSTAAP